MVSRATRTPFGEWWWTVDKLLVGALATLMLGGIVLSLAASPPVAARLRLEPFYFVNRHVMYPAAGHRRDGGDLVLVSHQIRRLALCIFVVSVAWSASRFSSAPRSRARAAG